MSANIERFREFDEFGTRHIRSSQEDGHLQADTRRASGRRIFHALPLFENLDLQVITLLSTKELVRMLASGMPERATRRSIKLFIIC